MTRNGARGCMTRLRDLGSRGRSPSLAGALVHAGEAGFERVDARGLPLQGGQQFPVVGVELLQDAPGGLGVGSWLPECRASRRRSPPGSSARAWPALGLRSFFASRNAEPTAPAIAAQPSPEMLRAAGIGELRFVFIVL